ncbi:DUF4345 domain-containing protein [Sphingomonas gilva]|uniref:DUF4345 domain-containing protein n=1 Tax=Sphingomonas gilva TaxID=2305907 RepID=A0A396RP38_9SPHN|nr:DUF4345 domain-containing protein [Sphingomonas gilva]RHW18294.1 DUF4345 domain-containing protein [Sphingomonas gilva]
MTLEGEKRLLQAIVGLACLVPLSAGLWGVLSGPGWLRGVEAVPIDLDSHFRYVSGVFLGVGIGFVTCLRRIETRGDRFRLLGALVVLGGLARLISLLTVGQPSGGHVFGLAMELGVTPCLIAWQASFAKRWAAAQRIGSSPGPTSALGR